MSRFQQFFYVPEGIVRASGPDAAEFLQGQFSNDLLVEVGSVVFGLWLNRKGKIVADSFVLREAEDSFLLISYYSSSDAILERLDAYIIMDEVELEKIEKVEGKTVWLNDELEAALLQAEVSIPEKGKYSKKGDVVIFRGLRGCEDSVEILKIGSEGIAFQSVGAGYEIEEMSCEEVGRLAVVGNSPIFKLGIEDGKDLPQEVGLGESGVAYNKGCYLGQEVMARIKSMGRVRRELKPAILESAPSSLGEPARVFDLVDDAGRRVGEFRSVASCSNRVYGFAMLRVGIETERWFARLDEGDLSELELSFVE
ncbi:hypothetical protein MLD52_01125 [Puniceicoccaceae bacterium K14]|nr:hypothetical protein [Puniceicoccaceae bacterium K14]